MWPTTSKHQHCFRENLSEFSGQQATHIQTLKFCIQLSSLPSTTTIEHLGGDLKYLQNPCMQKMLSLRQMPVHKRNYEHLVFRTNS